MNYEILRSWFQQSPEMFLLSLLFVCVGVMSAFYWVCFALARAGFFSASLGTKLTFAAVAAVITGTTCVAYTYDYAYQGFGYSLAISVGVIWFMHYFIRLLRWGNNWN